MRSGGLSWIAVAAFASSCGQGTGSAEAGNLTTSLRTPASFAAAPGDVLEMTLEPPIGFVGPIDISRLDVTVRSGPSGTTVKTDVRATALETIDTLHLNYCGPPLNFLSVDGSTVVVTVEDDELRAPLHSPVQAESDFAFRFLTVVPLDHVAEGDIGDVAADLLCR